MTEILKKEFSRTAFVKGGGALVVGFAVGGSVLAGKAQAADPHPYTSYGPADSSQIDSWLAINADNTASVKIGKVELGQGSMTGLLMIAAEELDMELRQMRAITNDTDVTPNQGTTAGSSAISSGGKQTRAAAAAARDALLGMASTQLGVPKSSLSVSKGVVSGGGKSVTYGQLLGGKLFNVKMGSQYNLAPTQPPSQSVSQSVASTGSGSSQGLAAAEVLPTPPFVPSPGQRLSPGAPGTKPVGQYKLVGIAPGPGRVDIPDKVNGRYTYVQNVRVPGMLHGRIVRPRGQGAYGKGTNPKVLSVDASSLRRIPGAKLVQKGNFVGVVAPEEYQAIQAAAQLKVKWEEKPPLPSSGNLWSEMRKQDTAGQVAARIAVNTGNVDTALASAAHVVKETYTFPYNGHLPIGPSCAVAWVTPQGVRVFSNSQNIYSTRSSIAGILKVPLDHVRVTYYEGSSVFGNAPYDDAAQSAAIMSQAVGAPVRVQFMRWDEHGWDNYGPPQMTDVRAGVDASGNIVGTETTIFTVPWYTSKPPEAMLGYAQQFSTTANPDTTNTGTQYNLKNRRVIGKSLPLENKYFKTIWLRAPAAPQTTWAYEQMVDELAHAAKMDPYEFRLKNIATLASDEANGITALTWDRWKNVLVKAAQMAKWQPKVAASNVGTGNLLRGRGIALGSFAGTAVANVADIEVNMKTGRIRPLHIYCAQDNGLTVFPDGVANQGVGSIVQGVSRVLTEQLAFNKHQVTGLDWVTYPMLRFKDSPDISFEYIQRTDIPATVTGVVQPNGTTRPASTVEASGVYVGGSGEPPLTSVGAAIANAFFDATGVRMRSAPMSPARVRATIKAARAGA
jgi:CO/xanthine dehydrogenase Mo-binding subunit